MKKAILTIGLFSMVMVLTSFTNTIVASNHGGSTSNDVIITHVEPGGNGQQVPASRSSLELALEPGGNGQQVPASKSTL
jgi:peptidoglycan hydrolase CwlO-like protein